MNAKWWITALAVVAVGLLLAAVALFQRNSTEPGSMLPAQTLPVVQAEPVLTSTATPRPSLPVIPTEVPPPMPTPEEIEPDTLDPAPAVRRMGPYRIEGSVINIARAPVDYATVEIRRLLPGDENTGRPITLQTDDVGRFSIGLFEPGQYVLTAIREGYTRSTATVEFWMQGLETAEIILRPGDVIYGTVRQNLTGRLLPNIPVGAAARARAYSRDEMRAHRWIETRTNDRGEYRFDGLLPDVPYHLWVADGEHEPMDRPNIRPGGSPVDFYLNPGWTVQGRVVWSEDGSPVSGARVGFGFNQRFGGQVRRMMQQQGWAALADLVSATSDGDGYFTLGGLPRRRMPIGASFREDENLMYFSQPVMLDPESSDSTTSGQEILLEITRQPPARIFGTVRDLERRGVRDATVRIRSGLQGMLGMARRGGGLERWAGDLLAELIASDSAEVLTDAGGEYEIFVYQGGFFSVHAEKLNHVGKPDTRDRILVRQGQEYEMNFTLIPGVHLSGRVVDASSGRPVGRVPLQLVQQVEREGRGRAAGRWGGRPDGQQQTVVSNTDGRFDFGVVELGRYQILVQQPPPDYRQPDAPFEVLLSEPGKREVEVPLPPGYSIAGVVYGIEGMPASGVSVQGMVFDSRIELRDESDALGRFLLDGFPPDAEVRLMANPPRFGENPPAPRITDPFTLRQSIDDYEIRLPRSSTLTVLVQTEAGQPLSGQMVVLEFVMDEPLRQWNQRRGGVFRHNRPTGREGRVQFTDLAPGQWRVTVQTIQDPVIDTVDLGEGQQSELVLVIPDEALVDNSGVLAGVVLFEDGSPASNYRLNAVMLGAEDRISAGRTGNARTDDEGRFRIRNLRQDADFRLEVHRRPRIIQHQVRTTNESIEIRIPPESSITVRVEDPAGDPPRGNWSIRLIHMDGPRGTRPVDRDPMIDRAFGQVTWDGIDAGEYRAIVTSDEFARTISEPIHLEQGLHKNDDLVRLARPSVMIGKVMDAQNNRPVVAAEVEERFAPGSIENRLRFFLTGEKTFTAATGDFLLEGLPPGPVLLRVRHPAYEDGEYAEDFIPPGDVDIRLNRVESGQ